MVKFISDNKSWIFDGIAGVVVASILAYVAYRWQKRERLLINPKKFSPAHDLEWSTGAFDVETMEDTTTTLKGGVERAKLKILCHNLAATPVTLDEVKLLNADTDEEFARHDAKAQRIDGHASDEIEIGIGSPDTPCYKPPSWRGRITVTTARRKIFSSASFNFADLV